ARAHRRRPRAPRPRLPASVAAALATRAAAGPALDSDLPGGVAGRVARVAAAARLLLPPVQSRDAAGQPCDRSVEQPCADVQPRQPDLRRLAAVSDRIVHSQPLVLDAGGVPALLLGHPIAGRIFLHSVDFSSSLRGLLWSAFRVTE